MTGSLKGSEGRRGTTLGGMTNGEKEGVGAGGTGAGVLTPGGGGLGADGIATGGVFEARKDVVRSDAEEAERSS